ncbi:hypothetical protein Q765_03475 [Flavobacterium rivuli WB 3.3-2 = DSM 21788]|uniref:Imm33-like domain-containing protein n=1 Tax=Flavobacterium rivuli WB 3.3-2 = DSM 21788 TaxID=1121895 RepID=A0A0A2M640_9FLAO|nr:hypothetical protein [Flavobacterium rivuli]KGO88122.1 hypothetical protein Q765_03475 [Flavobacterium rivuli WB 3.3-2 = DSM 21788]
MDYQDQQKAICDKYNVPCVPSNLNDMLGIAKNVASGLMPINGLRHPLDGNTTGWYIWAGEEFSEEHNFFKRMHVKHLQNINPEIIKYLALPPGHRFLIDDKGYEDVWEDLSLLDI